MRPPETSARAGTAAACLCALWLTLGASAKAAPAESAGAAELVAALADGDPLVLAAWVQHAGDAAVLARLTPATEASIRLGAVRASVFLRDPEQALLPLAKLLSERDPEVAEAAARRVRQIAQALALQGLARREILPSELAPARAQLHAAAAETRLRPDLRRLLAEADQLLGSLGVPIPVANPG
jgi:hypothetical protein